MRLALPVPIELTAEMFPVFASFRDETTELRAELTADLLTLEANPDAPGAADRIGRTAHTLKGNAASLGLHDVSALMHSVESLLAGTCVPGRRLDAVTIDAVLLAVDEVRRRTEDILANRPDSSGVAEAQARIDKLLAGTIAAPQPATLSTPAPAMTEGEDLLKIGASQFEGFTQVLDELESAGLALSGRAAACLDAVRSLEKAFAAASGVLPAEVKAELEEKSRRSLELHDELVADVDTVASVAVELRGALEMLQLVRASSMLDPLRRAVHDHARRVGKEALLEIAGAQCQVDRRVLQVLRGALAHVLRNAVDHGIESPSERAAVGKPPRGKIVLDLAIRNDIIEVAVADDGRGLDADKIGRTAVARGALLEADRARMAPEALLQLIWHRGFSTSETVTETSGRGVGLDAVRDCVTQLSGTVSVESTLGRGTTMRFRVPVSQHLRGRTH